MDGERCPRCRTLCYEGLMGYPHCRGCHEQLRQCRYCGQQRDGLCLLDEAVRPALDEADGRPVCAAFETRLTAAERREGWHQSLSGRGRLAAMSAVAALLLLILLFVFIGRPEPLDQVRAEDSRVFVLDGRAVASFAVSGDPRFSNPARPPAVVLRIEPPSLFERPATGYYADEMAVEVSERAGPHYTVTTLPRPRGQPLEIRCPLPPEGSFRLRLTVRAAVGAPRELRVTVSVVGVDGEVEGQATTMVLRGAAVGLGPPGAR